MTREIWDAMIADGVKPVCEYTMSCGRNAVALVGDCACCSTHADEAKYSFPEDDIQEDVDRDQACRERSYDHDQRRAESGYAQ
jgi:hypothetical protein